MSAERAEAQAMRSWAEEALTDGWASGWAISPLRWAPRVWAWRRWRGLLWVALPWLLVAAMLAGFVPGVHLPHFDLLAMRRFARGHFFPIALVTSFLIVGIGFALPALFAVVVARVVRRPKGRRGDRTYGTAQWHSVKREWWNPQQAVAAALVIRPESPPPARGWRPGR